MLEDTTLADFSIIAELHDAPEPKHRKSSKQLFTNTKPSHHDLEQH